MNRKTATMGGVALVAAILALGLMNTRIGVFVVLDLAGGGEDGNFTADPRSAPIEIEEYATAVPAYSLPTEIEQPSGITYLESSDTFAIVTDQAELFLVTNEFETIRSKTELAGGLLLQRQGSTEAVGALDGGRVAVAGEIPTVDIWGSDSGLAFLRSARVELSGLLGEAEFSGIAYDPRTKEYYLASDETFSIVVVDENGQMGRELELEARTRTGRQLDEYQISGLEYSEGFLFAVTENYNTIFVIDPAFGIARTIGIEKGGQISAIAVSSGRAYLTVDHNYFDERPPILTVDLD